MPDLAWNRAVWDRDYKWPADGDEWDDFARFCGVPYEKWKRILAETFLIPYLRPSSKVLEIGPGHGRWSDFIPPRIPQGMLYLADISKNCIDFCAKRFAKHQNVRYEVSDGKKLAFLAKDSLDFIFSFDTFVHIEEAELRSYVREFFRTLKPQGMGVIHHVGTPSPEQRKGGARSMVGAWLFAKIIRDCGFFLIRQTDEWKGGCNLKMSGDVISIFAKP